MKFTRVERLTIDALVIVIIVALSIWAVGEFAYRLDKGAFEANQQVDDAGKPFFDDWGWEKYKVQAVESHVLGVGIALAMEMGLLSLYLAYRIGSRDG